MKWKFPTLFSLYIAQSIPMSFFSTVVPVIMRQEHYSLEAIGLLQLVKLPWIFKFLWAPLVDNNARDRKQLRRWIVLSELFYYLDNTPSHSYMKMVYKYNLGRKTHEK